MKKLMIMLLAITYIFAGCQPSIESLVKQGKYKDAYLHTQEKSKFLDELYSEGKYKEVFECINEDVSLRNTYIEKMVEDNMIQQCLDIIRFSKENQDYFATLLINKNKFVTLEYPIHLSSALDNYNFLSEVLQNVLKYYINLSEFKTAYKAETLKLQRNAINDISGIYILTNNSDYKDDWDEKREKESVEVFIKQLSARIIIYNKGKRKLYEFQHATNKLLDIKRNGLISENSGDLDNSEGFTLGSKYTGYNYYRLLSKYIYSNWITGLKEYVASNLK